MNPIQKLKKFHDSSPGHLVFGTVELILAALFVSSALTTGNIISTILAVILTVGFIKNYVRLMRELFLRLKTSSGSDKKDKNG